MREHGNPLHGICVSSCWIAEFGDNAGPEIARLLKEGRNVIGWIFVPRLKWLLAAGLFLGFSLRANASLETITIDFTASGFQAGAPVDPVQGSVTLTLDTAVAVADQTTGITLNSLNLQLDSPIAFQYEPLALGNSVDILEIGGLFAGAAGLGYYDFGLQIRGLESGAPVFYDFGYTTSSYSQFGTNTGSITVTGLNSAVPEPPYSMFLGLPLWFALLFGIRRHASLSRGAGSPVAEPVAPTLARP
jgi:hypothetical protein